MSEGYIINSLERNPDWKIDKAEFIGELRSKWKSIEISENISGTYILRWLFRVDSLILLGGIQSDNHTLTMDGGSTLTLVAEFAIWYRKLVPEDCKIFLWKGSQFENPIELNTATSEAELVNTLMHY